MERFLFEDVEEFVDKFLEEYENYENDKDFDGISIVAHYEHIRDILNYLVKNTCFEVYDVELKTYESDFYRDEYTLVVDEDKKIWCQKVKFDKGYLHLEEKVIFVHSDVNSQFAIKNKGENMIEFDFGTEEETEFEYNCTECCGCCECNNELAIESDDDVHGFTVNRSDENSCYSYSFYSTSEKLVEEMARLFK